MSKGLFGRIGELAVEVFRPPHDATSASIRKSGAFGMAVGMVLFMLSSIILFVAAKLGLDLGSASRVILVFTFPGFAFAIVGGYRLIAGREPEGASSLHRITLGLAGGLFAIFLLFVLMFAAIAISELLKR